MRIFIEYLSNLLHKMFIGDWINLGMLLVAIYCALFTHHQWQKLKKKIVMIDEAGKMIEILPAWYTKRMKEDHWVFGLLTQDSRTLVVTNIKSLSNDGKWMDVELAVKNGLNIEGNANYVFAIAEDRKMASVQVASIVAAIELVTS